MKPRTVRRLCLVDGMNLDHIEGWLESMAARGLHYDHSDAFLFPPEQAGNKFMGFIPYRRKNLQGVSVHAGAAFYDHKPVTLKLYTEYGGVCGAVSKGAAGFLRAKGVPAWAIGQPTNKAAREMKERIARQVGMERARYLWMGTFHSIFSRILRAEATFIGFTSQFTIYDTADSKSLLRSIIKEMGLDEKTYKPGVVQARISNAKNHLVCTRPFRKPASCRRII